MERPKIEPIKLPRGGVWPRVVVLLAALAITFLVFAFWAKFAGAWINFMEMPAAKPPPPTGPVTVDIIPSQKPAEKPVCGKDKEHPCPPIP